MSAFAPLFEGWDEAHRELYIALEGCPDEDVWKRPHPRLLSVGELAGHIAYAQVVWAFGGGDFDPDLSTLPVQSPLLNRALRYYPATIAEPTTLDLNAAQITAEIRRIHEAAVAAIAERDRDEQHPHWGNWWNLVQYQVFHVAYHTGQIYSVRHLLGHETEDN